MVYGSPYHIRLVSSWPPRQCGIGTFTQDLATALEDYTSEISTIRVSPIDKGNNRYRIPADKLVIDQNDSESWKYIADQISAKAIERRDHPTIVIMQHEYGLDGPEWTAGRNYIEMAERLKNRDITTIVQLHTVLKNPKVEHPKKVLKELAEKTDGLIVPSAIAIEILASPDYGIDPSRIQHIDHGVRAESRLNRAEAKKKYGLEKKFVVITPGLKSPGKGIEYAIESYGKFINESLTPSQKKNTIHIIPGQYHPEFKNKNNGKDFREYENKIKKTLEEHKLKPIETPGLEKLTLKEFEKCNTIIIDNFIPDNVLLDLYSMADVVLITPRNTEQISSGILSDTIGSGRVAITTKFTHAIELVQHTRTSSLLDEINTTGLTGIGNPHARGLTIDLIGEKKDIPDTEQAAEALHYCFFNQEAKRRTEENALKRGESMKWENVAFQHIRYIGNILEAKETNQDEKLKFNLEKKSKYEDSIKEKLKTSPMEKSTSKRSKRK